MINKLQVKKLIDDPRDYTFKFNNVKGLLIIDGCSFYQHRVSTMFSLHSRKCNTFFIMKTSVSRPLRYIESDSVHNVINANIARSRLWG